MNAPLKYSCFIAGGLMAYFKPIEPLILLVVVLFCTDFALGVCKSIRLKGCWKGLASFKLRWSLAKAAVYLLVVSYTFFICEKMEVSNETIKSVIKLEVWSVVYIEGLSIVENLKVLFPNNKFLDIIHYFLSVEFLKYVPQLANFLKKKGDVDEFENGDNKNHN